MGVLAKAAGSLWDWIEAGYPEEVAKRIVSGELPMDEASRMARASEQGYGDVLYRGHSNQRAPYSDQDMWLSNSPDVAQTYADAHKSAGKVTPLRTNADYHGPGNLAYVRGDGKMHHQVTTNSIKNPGIEQGIIKGTDNIAEVVKESGQYQGTHFRNIKDEFNTASSTEPSDVYNILGSRPDVNIRHADAAFDPQYKGSNIMGSALAGAVGLGALSQSEDADARLLAPHIKDSGMISAPRSENLFDITMGARDLERRLDGSPASLLFPSGLVDYLETVNREEEDPTMMTRALALLDLF